MLKETDRIAWRYKGNKGYSDGLIKEIKGKMMRIADSCFGIGLWLNNEEIEIEILERTDMETKNIKKFSLCFNIVWIMLTIFSCIFLQFGLRYKSLPCYVSAIIFAVIAVCFVIIKLGIRELFAKYQNSITRQM